jgi:hypothetical protein
MPQCKLHFTLFNHRTCHRQHFIATLTPHTFSIARSSESRGRSHGVRQGCGGRVGGVSPPAQHNQGKLALAPLKLSCIYTSLKIMVSDGHSNSHGCMILTLIRMVDRLLTILPLPLLLSGLLPTRSSTPSKVRSASNFQRSIICRVQTKVRAV